MQIIIRFSLSQILTKYRRKKRTLAQRVKKNIKNPTSNTRGHEASHVPRNHGSKHHFGNVRFSVRRHGPQRANHDTH